MTAQPVVLVIEDHAELRVALKDALASQGYEVLLARDDAEALENLRSRSVDLLISDLADPQQEADRMAAIRDEFPGLPIVALSGGSSNHTSLLHATRRDPNEVRRLAKPFRLGELLSVSRELLGSP